MPEVNVLVEPVLSVDGQTYRVLRYEIEETMFTVSHLRCEIQDDAADAPEPSSLIDKDAELTLSRSDGAQERFFYGKVAQAERVPSGDDIRTVHLFIVPALWQLQKRADCRIFQKLSVVDIVKKVLEGAGVPSSKQEWKTTGSYPEREYVVQYRETDLDFMLRLLSEEGIYFAVHHKDGSDVAVFGDEPTGLGDIEGTKVLSFIAEGGAHGAVDHVMRVSRAFQVRSDKVTLRDYNPDKPKLKLEATVEGKDEGAHALEVYQYPGRFAEPSVGQKLAQTLLDSIQAERDVVRADTGVLTMFPGLRFEIEDHPYGPVNEEYLITRVRITGKTPRMGQQRAGGQDGNRYMCEVWGVPTKTTAYRPPRRQREATIPALQTAVTTGPSGQEIHVHEGGQVKAQFHWDRQGKKDENSSRWMRTSQLALGGSMLLPRMEWEVSILHNEGDADKPYVMGRMYNGVKMPPYALPKEAAKSSLQTGTSPGDGSSNEMRMGDTKGSEQMFFNASKDMTVDVKNNTTEHVGNDSEHKIGSNHKKNVTDSSTCNVGSNQSIEVSGNQVTHVETFMVEQIGGDHKLTITGDRDLKIGGDHKRDVTGNSTLDVGGMHIELVVGSITDKTLAAFKHEVSAVRVLIVVADHTVTVGKARNESTDLVKIIAVKGGRGVTIGTTSMQKCIGAIINICKGNKVESSGASYTEIAAGAQIVKAKNIVLEAKTLIAAVMGASTLVVTPALVALAGISVKLDGDTVDTAALVVDN